VAVVKSVDVVEHLQEDVLDGQYRVVLYRHPAAQCNDCKAWVQKAGDGEILRSRIGPHLRSIAVFLRNGIGVSYRKVPKAIEELFGIRFTPAALLGFEASLAQKAEPIVEDVAKKLGSSDGAVHADETYWTLDGDRAYYWVHGDEKLIHFQFDTSRSGEVSRNVLGNRFTGTLVTDCYSGYHAHAAGAKQKCLAHLARTARDWQKLVARGTSDYRFFENVRQFVKRGCDFSRRRRDGELTKKRRLPPKPNGCARSWRNLKSTKSLTKRRSRCKTGCSLIMTSGWRSLTIHASRRPTISLSGHCARWWSFARSPSAIAVATAQPEWPNS
jgi:hypothetical protein